MLESYTVKRSLLFIHDFYFVIYLPINSVKDEWHGAILLPSPLFSPKAPLKAWVNLVLLSTIHCSCPVLSMEFHGFHVFSMVFPHVIPMEFHGFPWSVSHAFPCFSILFTLQVFPMLAWEACVKSTCFPWKFDLL